jgi:hypothetical protein
MKLVLVIYVSQRVGRFYNVLVCKPWSPSVSRSGFNEIAHRIFSMGLLTVFVHGIAHLFGTLGLLPRL